MGLRQRIRWLASLPWLACAVYACLPGGARWSSQSSGTTSEFRGISAANASVVWAAGRNGTYARTVDGGATWISDTVPGATQLFFIDVHAVGGNTAYLLGTHFEGGLGSIYRTTDAGNTWTLQYNVSGPGVFFDGMAFWDAERGVAFSDPVDGSFLIVTTENGGATWERVPPENIPPPLPGEAGFAASGTAIAVEGAHHVWFGTGGGRVARVFRSSDRGRTWSAAETPLPANQTSGIFGIAFWNVRQGVAVGGDYTQRYESTPNVLRTDDGGRTWALVGSSEPSGVRYGVTSVASESEPILIATGPSGWGYSLDRGVSWTTMDTIGYNTIAAHSASRAVWVAGESGRIAAGQAPKR